MQRHRNVCLSLPRETLIVGLLFALPWAGGCSSENPVITERVMPPDVSGGASETGIAKSQTPKKSRSSRPVAKSIKSVMGGGEDK